MNLIKQIEEDFTNTSVSLTLSLRERSKSKEGKQIVRSRNASKVSVASDDWRDNKEWMEQFEKSGKIKRRNTE